MKTVDLNEEEKEELFKQDPSTERDGGFQKLLVDLQRRVTSENTLNLTDDDLERIPRYAFDYGNGGWEQRLSTIFESHLGPKLGR